MPHHRLLGDGNYQRFIAWLNDSGRSVSLKLAYVDVANDLVAGLLLAQILYWFGQDQAGKPRVRKWMKERFWTYKRRSEWHEECRLSEKQYDRAIKILEEKGFVTVELHRANGTPTPHIAVNWEALALALEQTARVNRESAETEVLTLTDGEKPPSIPVNPDFDQRSQSITKELLSETSSEVNNSTDVVAHLREKSKNHSSYPQKPLSQPTAVFSEQAQDEIAQQLLGAWRTEFPGEADDDDQVAAARELVNLGVRCYRPDSVVSRFVRNASKENIKTIRAVLEAHRPMLHERLRVVELLGVNTCQSDNSDRKLVSFLSGWAYAFLVWEKRQYQFTTQDIQSARDFITNSPDMETAEIVRVANRAWRLTENEATENRFDKYFHSRNNSKTVRTFLKFYEEIAQEVYR